jgi:hypothetical protein
MLAHIPSVSKRAYYIIALNCFGGQRGYKTRGQSAILEVDMSIPNVKRFRISSPDGSDSATLMTVIPKGTDLNAYLLDASARFDWKAHKEAKAAQFKIRVGQQKQQKKK